MSMTAARWGRELVVEQVRGNPCRVYALRPRALGEVLAGARRWSGRDHLVDDGRRLRFDDLLDAVDRVAAQLVARGVLPGDRVLLLARNSVEWVVTYWAVVRTGGVAVLGNAWWKAEEARRAVDLVQAALVFADPERAELLAPGTALLSVGEVGELLTGGQASADVLPIGADEDAPAVVVFTSGTTGPPKGAVLSHRSVIANQQGFLATTRRLPDELSDDHPGTTSLLSTPLFHTGGLQAITTALITGGRLVFSGRRFDPAAVLELIERERVTVWSGVPTMVQRVIEHPDARTRDLTSVRAVGLGGAPLPRHVIERIPEVFPKAGRGLSTNYGSTEAGGIVASAAGPAVLDRPGTSGRPLPPVELRLGPDAEILVRSAALMTGYWGEPDSPVDAEGYLHTGDVGRLDDDGYLYVVDRLKDIIIRGGENIAASHVEHALCAHADVAGAAAVGLPHHDLGEQVGAVVVLRPGREATPELLTAFLAERLANFELPTRWWLRTEPLPETVSGKIDKRSLRATFPPD